MARIVSPRFHNVREPLQPRLLALPDMKPVLQFENNGGGSKAQILLRQAGCSLHIAGSELLPATVFERTRRTTACPIRIDPAEVPTMATLSRRSSMLSTFSSPTESAE